MIIPKLGLDEWLNELKPYQRELIKNLVENYGEEVAIEKWLSANGPSDTIQFGGDGNVEPFLQRFKDEFNKFICGHEDYKKERKEYETYGEEIRTMMVASIAGAIGAKIGIASAIISPIVVLSLYTVGKIGLNAYCKECSM